MSRSPRIALTTAAFLALLTLAAGTACQSPARTAEAAEPSKSPKSPGKTDNPSPSPTPTPDLDATVDAALAALPVPSGRYALAVTDLTTGDTATHGGGTYDTASIAKVDILAALLLKAQDAHRKLSASETRLAEAMITRSDNDAADALWQSIGGAAGLAAANKRLGLTDTDPGSGGHWGLTRTTAADQLRLLKAVFTTDSPLTRASRAVLDDLMCRVVPDQRWGISAAVTGAADGSVALKNGWLPRTATGRWDVNSIGRAQRAGHTYLIAVLSDGHTTRQHGIETVEHAAETAVDAAVEAAAT
ncbi:serine hydrolase [Streptomyces boninensis]|uniref:serine hydrolase n=1 Tax=Streptomyces boninensis TaxID=2039455 RepID=UPI003B211C24